MRILPKKNILLFSAWLMLCLASFMALNWYKMQPGPVGKLQRVWPQNVQVSFDKNKFNLIMFAHPKCGCTTASLIELEKILHTYAKQINVKIFFYRPTGSDENWSNGDSKKMASKIINVLVYDDEGGQIARRFGALTSGQVMLYSHNGELNYAGGITESRGHIGANAGSRSIASVIDTGKASLKMEHTFGCVLFNEAELKEYKRE